MLFPGSTNTTVPCQQGPGEPAAVTRGRKQIVVMLGTVVLFFFACLLPFKVLTMWVVISPYEILDHINLELYFNILYFCRLMFYINSAINPILYNTMSSRSVVVVVVVMSSMIQTFPHKTCPMLTF